MKARIICTLALVYIHGCDGCLLDVTPMLHDAGKPAVTADVDSGDDAGDHVPASRLRVLVTTVPASTGVPR